MNEEKLWENPSYFLHEIIPVAEEVGIKMAIYPDAPPYSIFGLPQMITGSVLPMTEDIWHIQVV